MKLGEGEIGILDNLTSLILTRAAVTSPPVDPYFVAQKINSEVIETTLPRPIRGIAFIRAGDFRIEINLTDKQIRKTSALAHEIMECALKPFIDDRDERHELAWHGAAFLLMPSQWFERDCRKHNFDIEKLKEIYSTASYELIALRTLSLAPGTVTVYTDGRITNHRSTFSSRREMTELERDVLDKAIAARSRTEASDGVERVVAYPIYRGRHKRTIIRSFPAEYQGLGT